MVGLQGEDLLGTRLLILSREGLCTDYVIIRDCHAGLEVLELGSNRIRAIEGLGTLGALRELWLGRNRIAEITDLSR